MDINEAKTKAAAVIKQRMGLEVPPEDVTIIFSIDRKFCMIKVWYRGGYGVAGEYNYRGFGDCREAAFESALRAI